MKRDMDVIRSMLIRIEDEPAAAIEGNLELPGVTGEVIDEHTRLLLEAGFIEVIDRRAFGLAPGTRFMNYRLTWSGHEFVSSVRDPDTWKRTKEGATKVGSWSLGVMAELAKAVALSKMKDFGLG